MIIKLKSLYSKKYKIELINKYLRELGKLIEMNEKESATNLINNTRETIVKHRWELLTTHVGRRTFATRAMKKGIPINVIMQFTGHKKLESFQKYIDVSNFIYKDVINEIWSN